MTNINTYKSIGVALGVGLGILWIAGLSSPYAPAWMTWLDGVGAVCAFLISGSASERNLRSQRNSPILLSIGLFALWIAGLATGAVGWMCWWTFGFACACLLYGVSTVGSASVPKEEHPRIEKPEDDFRKTG